MMGTKIAALLLTPPGIILLLALIGFLIQIRWRTTGIVIVGLSLAVLFALSLPMTGRALIAPLEADARPLPPASLTPDAAKKQADAIVVLGEAVTPKRRNTARPTRSAMPPWNACATPRICTGAPGCRCSSPAARHSASRPPRRC